MTESDNGQVAAAAGHMSAGLERLFGPVGSADVFSAPVERGESIVITAAAIERFGGFGFGGGEGDDGDAASGSGAGGGGGGRVEARPVAVIRIDGDGVSVVPVLDTTRIAIAAIGVALALMRAMRRR